MKADRNKYFLIHLQDLLARKVVRQKEIATATGFSSSYVSDIVNGKKPPSGGIMEKVASLQRMDLDEFIRVGRHLDQVRGDMQGYNPSQVNYFGEREAVAELVGSAGSAYPDLENYMEMFRLAMKTGNKKLMVSILDEMKGVIEG